MSGSFVVYIDESGDEGFVFREPEGQGSSHWFVLSAVITRAECDLETVKLVDQVRHDLARQGRAPLHFRKLKHEHRVPYIARIAKARLRTVTVLVHKPSLHEPEKFQQRYRLYFYASRYLLERVSWFCRDNRSSNDPGDGSAKVVFSNRAGMSYAELREYILTLKEGTSFFGVRIDWDVIRPDQIRACNHDKLMGLQIADAVASGFFYGVQSTRQGFTESRYAEMLQPVVYRHRTQYLGYGLKLWPRDVRELSGAGLEWIERVYL